MEAQEGTPSKLSSLKRTIAENQLDSKERKIGEMLPACPGHEEESCSVRTMLDRVSDKWYMISMLTLGQAGKLRFNELKKHIGNISQRMLTVTLRAQEEDGLIRRTVFPEVPPRVEYELTELGRGFLLQLLSMAEWIDQHKEEIVQARKNYRQ